MKLIKFVFIFAFIFIIFSTNLVRAGFFDWFSGIFESTVSCEPENWEFKNEGTEEGQAGCSDGTSKCSNWGEPYGADCSIDDCKAVCEEHPSAEKEYEYDNFDETYCRCKIKEEITCVFITSSCSIEELDNNEVKILAEVENCEEFYVSTSGSSDTSYKYKDPINIDSNDKQEIYAVYECKEDTDATFKFELRKSGVYPSPKIECSGKCPYEEPSECSLSITSSDGIGGGSDENITYKGKIENCKGKKYKSEIEDDSIVECEDSISYINSDDKTFETECECKKDGSTYLDLKVYSSSKTYAKTRVIAHCHDTEEETDEPCDDEGDWQLKEEIYCFEGDTKKGFCLDDNTYESNKDHIEIVKEGTNTHCVKCKDDDCCHDIRSLCFDYKSSSSTGCIWSPGTVSSACSGAGGDTCDEKGNLTSCILKESQGKIGLIYCADCGGTTTTSSSSTTSTSTSSTSTSSTSSTTTTTIPPHELTCDTPISVGENVVCTLSDCNKGLWILTNKEGNALQYPIVTEMPPSENAELGTTEEQGKILVRALCTQHDIPTINSYEVEVKKGVSLTCPEECEVDKECECVVEECTLGLFKAENEEDEPLEKNIAEAISESPYEYTFTAKESGKVKVIADCIDPKITKEQIVEITGEAEEEFNIKSVECNKNKCTIEVDKNTMEDDITIIINLFDEPDGTIFYSAQEDIDAEKTGEIEIDLEKIKTCPSGKDLKVIVLAYKADNLNKLLDRLKEDAFGC